MHEQITHAKTPGFTLAARVIYQTCGEDPDAVNHHYSAGSVIDVHDEINRENDGNHSSQSHLVSPAPKYEPSKFYEWTTSGADTAASSDKLDGYRPPTAVHDQKAPEISLQSDGDYQATDWQ